MGKIRISGTTLKNFTSDTKIEAMKNISAVLHVNWLRNI